MQKSLPSKVQLDQDDAARARRAGRGALVILTVFLATGVGATVWWARRGPQVMLDATYRLEGFLLWWNLILTEQDRQLILLLTGCLLVSLVVLAWFSHRFFWRALFPDLVRIDPVLHAGGRAEPIGRLYRARPFLDEDGRTRYRLGYKHGFRILPLFRLDVLDVDEAPQPRAFAQKVIHCGWIARVPGERWRRVATNDPYGAQPVLSTFRVGEVRDDRERKVGIVLTGSPSNPQVAQKKFHSERATAAWQHAAYRITPPGSSGLRPPDEEERP